MPRAEGPKSYHFPHFLHETPQELPKPQFQTLKVTTIVPVRSSMWEGGGGGEAQNTISMPLKKCTTTKLLKFEMQY